MRIWTLHPKYLDPRGLVALWREALLDDISGLLLGDKGFIRPILKEGLAQRSIDLPAPLRDNMRETRSKGFRSVVRQILPFHSGGSIRFQDQEYADNSEPIAVMQISALASG
ncbi:MAG: pyrimidine dimer DNA glycosylase/endonuclease V [Sterolibacterium sp.]